MTKRSVSKGFLIGQVSGFSFCFSHILALVLFCSTELGGLVAGFNSFGY